MQYGELPRVQLDGADYEGIVVKIPNPPKSAVLRLPANAEMLEYLDAQKSLRRSLGRRKAQTEAVPNEKADLALFKAIRLDKGASEFNAFEVATILGRLTYYEVTDCRRAGEGYQVTLQTPFGEVVHQVSVPTQKALSLYRRGIMASTDLPHGVEELRFRHGSASDLYDEIAVKVEGYADADPKHVPPHHKSAVAAEVGAAMEDLDPVLDPLA